MRLRNLVLVEALTEAMRVFLTEAGHDPIVVGKSRASGTTLAFLRDDSTVVVFVTLVEVAR